MATRRSRLQIKPNLGPKGATKPQGPAPKSSSSVDTSVRKDTDKNVENSAKLGSGGVDISAKIAKETPKQPTNADRLSDTKSAHNLNDKSVKSTDIDNNSNTGSVTELSNGESIDKEPAFTLLKDQDKVSTSKTSSVDPTEGKAVLPGKKPPPSIRNRLPKAKPNIPSRSGTVKLPPSNNTTNDGKQQDSQAVLANNSRSEIEDRHKNQQSLNTETNKDHPPANKEQEIQNVNSKVSLESTQKEQQKVTEKVPEIVVQPPQGKQAQPPTASVNVPSTPEKRPTEVTSSPLKPLLIRNRLPKAKPNLTDLTRNRRLTPTSQGFQQSPLKSPLKSPMKSPMKLVRPAASPLKAVRDLSMLDNVSEPPETSKEANVTVPPAVITVSSAQDKQPLVEQQQAEKRNRTMSMSEAATIKPKIKRPKVIPSADAPADRNKMKMAELIYWNPTRNPMKQKNNEPKLSTPLKSPQMTKNKLDDSDEDMDEENLDKEMDKCEDMPAPQVKIGPNGEIILNEASLVIENKGPIIEEDSSIIDETDSFVTYGSFREKRTRAFWSERETEKFFKALSHIGTDFSLMKKVFPKRTRVELKQKFRKEDRKNRHLIEKALNDKKPFNQKIIDEMILECNVEEEAKKTKKEREKKEKTENTENKEKKKKGLGRNYYREDDDEEQISSKNERSRSGRTVKRRFDSSFVNDFEDEGKYPVASWDVETGDKEKDRGEVVDILMNMREGKVPKTSESKSSQKSTVTQASAGTSTITSQGNSQIQNIQVSGLSDGGPFILVYSQPGPEAGPDAETVIHVYKLQGDIGDLSGLVGSTGNNSTNSANTESSNMGNDGSVVSVEYKTDQTQSGRTNESDNLHSKSLVDIDDNDTESRIENQTTVEVENEMSFVPFIPPACQARQDTVSPVLSHQVEESHALDEDNVVYVSYGEYNSELIQNPLPSSSDFNKTVQVEYTNENSDLQNSSLTHHEIPEENINCIDVPKSEAEMSQVNTNWKTGGHDVSGTENQDHVMTDLRDRNLTSSSDVNTS